MRLRTLDTDEAVTDLDAEEDDYSPLSGYSLVDRFPDLGCALAEPECCCCHCDLSVKFSHTLRALCWLTGRR